MALKLPWEIRYSLAPLSALDAGGCVHRVYLLKIVDSLMPLVPVISTDFLIWRKRPVFACKWDPSCHWKIS